MGHTRTGSIIFVLIILSLLLFFPNIFNQREIREFSGRNRLDGTCLAWARTDSARARISNFYDRGALTTFLLGQHYRELWSTDITLPVFSGSLDSLHFEITGIGGGQQTTSLKLRDQYDRSFTLRSIDKDQAGALPPWLHKTGIRTLFRDQASALHPFAALAVAGLSAAADIPTTKPQLLFVAPGDNFGGRFSTEVTNRIMVLEIEWDSSWKNLPDKENGFRILSSTKMLNLYRRGEITVNYHRYAYCRAFDILIGDWDRHGKQWKWMLDTVNMEATPLPVDRDMAFYQFDDGLVNRLTLKVNNKFQSFDADFADLSGYLKNGQELDTLFLPRVSESEWIAIGQRLQNSLTYPIIQSSFEQLPPEIYRLSGEALEGTLTKRLDKISDVTTFMSNVYK